MNIQWYPGHMTKAKRMMAENIALVDIIIELLDSRIPLSSQNPEIERLANGKPRIVVLNKADMSDPVATAEWVAYYKGKGLAAVCVDAKTGKGIPQITDEARHIMQPKLERSQARGRIMRPIRAMIAGIPNVGKSTLINKLVGKAAAKTADRPGVTRGKQWIRIVKDLELLDTPGLLWPKFDDRRVGLNLAFTGAINDQIIDIVELSLELIDTLRQKASGALEARYKVEILDEDTPLIVLEKIAVARGFRLKGGVLNLERTAITLIDEFRAARLGRITLELLGDTNA
ncbi:MAG: ribosome biogenesis GTPase YlqF [Defluviitaleaceae bacterium]|nr:ribosome biogenesis GTPase YlqF [Defluviitaleaceae bacterium]